MVFIESVELVNFKSFHHSRYIGPFLQTNAIVGPNGTGKSNILDAITFAFGDISKNLRVDRLKELIHFTSKDDTETSCSVIVRLTFPKDDKICEFERRLRKSGTDEFFINQKRTNKQEYIDYLEKHGIFAKHDNFVIRQGSINKMIQNGDNNRTKFIDVVSGSSNYDQACKEHQKAYEVLLKDVKTYQDAAQQTGTELYRLSIAHGKRKDIEEDLQKLAETRTDYYLLQMYPVEKQLESLETKFQKQKAKLEKDLTEPEEEIHDAQVQKQREVNALLAETKQMKAKKSLAETEDAAAKAKFDTCNQQVSFLENKVSTHEKMLKALQAKSQDKQDHRKDIDRKIAELQKELQSLENDYHRKSQTGVNEAELAQFYELSRFVDEDKISDDLRSREEKLEVLKKELLSFKSSLQMEEEKLVIKQRELSVLQSNDPQQIQLDNLKVQLNEIEAEIEKIKENDMKKVQYTKEFEEIQNKLADQDSTAEYNNKERMRDQIEREFLEAFPGQVFGILKKICTPADESYKLASIRVFQKWHNAFVVDSGETAAKCIQLLKEKKRPKQKFIPIDDTLRIRQITPDVQAILNTGKARLIRECINIRHENQTVGRAVDFVCGTILICDTAKEADDVAFNHGSRLTTVSKDGTLFNKNGKITGGSASLTQHGDPFNPSQLQTLTKRRAELIDLLRALPRSEGLIIEKQARANQLRANIVQFEKARPGLSKDKSDRIEAVNRFIQNIQATLNEKRGIIESTETKIQELEKEIQQLKVKKEALTKQIFAEFCKKNKIQDLSAFQNEDIQLQKSYSEKKSKILNEIKRYESEVQYENDSRSNERTLAEARLQSAKEELEKIRQEWKKARTEGDAKRAAFLKINTESEELEKELDGLLNELQEIKAKVKKIKDVKNKIKKIAKERDTEFDKQMDTLQRMFFECRVKQISLPLIHGNFENIELFEAGDSDPLIASSNVSHGSRVPLSECKADYSRFDELQDQLSNDDGRKKLVDKKLKEIAELERQLTVKESGALSVEDFNERIVKAREAEKENMAKFNVLSKNLVEARRRYEDTKNERKNLFMATLKKMQKDVDYYYKLLYNDATAQAYLNIVGSDEPYNSKILYDLVVPGKSRNSIDVLSGGEKAMAILALLFAGKPKNVNCILMDEFDEALDRKNMLLVSRFIDNMSTRGIQFIFISHRLELYAYANRLIGSSIHCENACNFGSIIFTIDVRDYMGEIGKRQYDPDDKVEMDKKAESNKEFTEALAAKDDEDAAATEGDENINARIENLMVTYSSQDVKEFLKGIEADDGFKKCQNNEDVQDLKELFTRLAFENF